MSKKEDEGMITLTGTQISYVLKKLKRLLELQQEIVGIAERAQKRIAPLAKELAEIENDPDPQLQEALKKSGWKKGRYQVKS